MTKGPLIDEMKVKRCIGIVLFFCFIVLMSHLFRRTSIVPVKKGNEVMMVSRNSEKKEMPSAKNRLAGEKSPYLLQHADNPVDWYPWGEEAFARAQKEDKPIFLSIGYSTCHWCHVMERESFENREIANVLNARFVSIKVDREERPDIDNIYMSAVMMLTGSGGWPISIFLTPDKEPFAGGTYFPPESKWGRPGFKEMLITISDLWKQDRKKAVKAGRSIKEAIQERSGRQADNTTALNKDTLETAYRLFQQNFDPQYGGFGNAPKFPTSQNLSFLLRYGKRTGEANALDMVEKTLQEMAKGGMVDHLGGGFHRYSTDRQWHVPHFEKMLYDQAMLARTYLEAYQVTDKEVYAQTARNIFDFVLRELRDIQGGFYSALDADSLEPQEAGAASPGHQAKQEKKEGAFYIWTYDEMTALLNPEEAGVFSFAYGSAPEGNVGHDPHGEFGSKNILYLAHDLTETAGQFKKSQEEIQKILEQAKKTLLAARAKRPGPHLDDKVLVDWNGLMISSLAFGSRVLQEPRYQEAAEKSAQFILKHLVREDGRLLHRYRDGEAAILGTIEDYAFFIHGLLDVYEATFKTGYLKEARRLLKEMIRLFWDEGDEKAGGFYFTAIDAEELLVRQKEVYDGAIPSGNSIAALDLIRLSRLTFDLDVEKKSEQLIRFFSQDIAQNPGAYAQLLIALDFAIGPSHEIVIAGQREDAKAKEILAALYSSFIPNKVVAYRPSSEHAAQDILTLVPYMKEQKAIDGQTTVYVCENYQCKLPTFDIQEFKSLMGISK